MEAAAEIKDIFGLTEEKAEKAVHFLEALVAKKTGEETAEKIEARVEKELAKEVRVLATKDDLNVLKDDLHAAKDDLQKQITGVREDLHREIAGVREDMLVMENRLSAKIESSSRTTLYWIVGLFVAMMAGFVATLFTILQKLG